MTNQNIILNMCGNNLNVVKCVCTYSKYNVRSVHREHIHGLFVHQYNGLTHAYCTTPVSHCNCLYLDCNPHPSKLF